jgi:hypothetical protein
MCRTGSPGQGLDRTVVVPALLEMMGQLGCDAFFRVAVSGLEELTDP